MRSAALIVLLGGCELIASIPSASTQNGDARTDTPDGETDDGPLDMGAACTDSTGCTDPASPVCGMPERACRVCLSDAECPTNVCLADGTCASDARFIYAAPAGSGAMCSLAQACSIDTAVTQLSDTKDIVKLAPGIYQRTATLLLTQSGTLAGPGATIRVLDNTQIYGIQMMGAISTTLHGLTLDGGTGGNAQIYCDGATGLTLFRATITGGDTGIYASSCPITMRDSRVTRSAYYALYLRTTTVDIQNSIFVNNVTNTTYMAAAVIFDQVTGQVVHSTFASNTPSLDGAMSCSASPQLLVKNIIASQNTAAGIAASCTVSNSIVDAAYAGPGTSNLVADPMFVDAAGGDYHILPASPARTLGDPAVVVGRDIDGEKRPSPAGTNPDSGADEIP